MHILKPSWVHVREQQVDNSLKSEEAHNCNEAVLGLKLYPHWSIKVGTKSHCHHTLNPFAGPASCSSPWEIGGFKPHYGCVPQEISFLAFELGCCVFVNLNVRVYRCNTHFHLPSPPPRILISDPSSECFLRPQAFYLLVLPLVLELYGILS